MNKQPKNPITLNCPTPILNHKNILLAHGGGGKLMNDLIEKILLPSFNNNYLEQRHDSATIKIEELIKNKSDRLAFTTDSYVVSPIFFKGGNIGDLAVNGTVNDLSMSGATPLFLSCSLIIEEGFDIEKLSLIIKTIANAANKAGVKIITGDTKVVEKGHGDGIYINTSGIGLISTPNEISPYNIKPDDTIIINGDLGRHGMAIIADRKGLEFESQIQSDCAPVNHIISKLLEEDVNIHCLRDLTRGGLASCLIELSRASGFNFEIIENDIPVREDVQGACELLGFDPLYVANEGRFAAFIPTQDKQKALSIISSFMDDTHPVIIGKVTAENNHTVICKSPIGVNRIIDLLSGEQLPRIC